VEKVLGKIHPETLNNAINLALALNGQEKHEEAKEMRKLGRVGQYLGSL